MMTPSRLPRRAIRSKASGSLEPLISNARSEQSAEVAVRLLDAAEQLFSEYGFNGVSTRRIAAAAHANQGAIPYYFGTKQNLLREVFLRRIGPVQEERHKRMAALMARDGDPDVREVLLALLEPAFRASRKNEHFRRLAGRVATDPSPDVRQVLRDIYSDDGVQIHRVLRAACPNLDRNEFFWRLNCVYGVMLYVQADTGKIQTLAGNDFDTSDWAVALQHVLAFVTAGMTATSTNG